MPFTLQIGQPAPEFGPIQGTDGKIYCLDVFKGSRLLLVVFSCNHCPYVIGSEERMIDLCRQYVPRGLGMVAINSNSAENHPDDDFQHMQLLAKEHEYPFPYLRDETQQAAVDYGALRTPHFFLFDDSRLLRYTGRMDDNPRQGTQATTHELRDAIEDLLAGRSVAVAVTNPIGCNIKWKGKPEHWMPLEACDLVQPVKT